LLAMPTRIIRKNGNTSNIYNRTPNLLSKGNKAKYPITVTVTESPRLSQKSKPCLINVGKSMKNKSDGNTNQKI
jgi:hypothetical protein